MATNPESKAVPATRALDWPPSAEDLRRLYLDERLSASKIAKAYGLRYASDKTAESTILYHLKRNGITRRDPAAHVRNVTDSMVDGWIERYQKGESLKQIAGSLVTPVTVFNHLHKRGLELRDKVEAQIKAVTKFEKHPFDGGEEERAYLLAFVRGDLAAGRHGRAIRIKTSSTHPAMIDLCVNLFLPYGPVRVYPRLDKKTGFEWQFEAELDSTFEFLLSQKVIAPTSAATRKIVLYYLAGLFDAEGSVWLRHNQRFGPRLAFANKDAPMLEWVELQLSRLGIHWHRSRPDKNGVCSTLVWRNADVLRLLHAMPLYHPEKKAKARVLFRFKQEPSEVHMKWNALLRQIEFDRLQFVELAKQELRPKQGY
jgi:hypothetical protein